MLGGQHALHLPGALDVFGRRLDEVKDRERADEAIPLCRAPGRVTDLEVADSGAGDLAHIRAGFDLLAYWREAEPRQHARVDEMAQRHASSRESRSARARRSSATATVFDRVCPARRSAWLTLSLIVSVPSCARAALNASSSISTRCFA